MKAAPNQNARPAEQYAAPVPPQNGFQNAPQQPAGAPLVAQPVKKTADQLRELYAARRRAQIDRKQAQIDRMNQFKAARATCVECHRLFKKEN